MKNASIPEADTVNAGTKFITRDTAQEQVGKHREMVCLIKTEERQRCRPKEKGCGRPLSEEEHSKEAVKPVT